MKIVYSRYAEKSSSRKVKAIKRVALNQLPNSPSKNASDTNEVDYLIDPKIKVMIPILDL